MNNIGLAVANRKSSHDGNAERTAFSRIQIFISFQSHGNGKVFRASTHTRPPRQKLKNPTTQKSPGAIG